MSDAPPQSTPHKRAPILNPYSATLQPNVATVRVELRLTMQHKLVRVSFEDFLDQFVPGEDPGDASFSGLFDKVPVRSGEVPVGSGEVPVKIVEADMYGPLVRSTFSCTPFRFQTS